MHLINPSACVSIRIYSCLFVVIRAHPWLKAHFQAPPFPLSPAAPPGGERRNDKREIAKENEKEER
jgi:hypothetical protein